MKKQGFINIRDVKLYYEHIIISRSSDSPQLVFLHDALGSVAQWKDFPAALSQASGLNAFIFDRPGHGRSDPMNSERRPDYLERAALELLPEVFQKLKIYNPVLIGHSDGGTIALLYATAFPVMGIICEAAHVYNEEVTRKGIKQAIQRKQSLTDRLMWYHGDKTEMLFDAWSETWLSEEFRTWDIRNRLAGISAPCLLIQGEKDEYATGKHVQEISRHFPGKSESILIRDCGHIPHHQKREEVLQIMTEFIITIQKEKIV
jgi:pimeloyl-ACP methyl ester carboxylesterase